MYIKEIAKLFLPPIQIANTSNISNIKLDTHSALIRYIYYNRSFNDEFIK